MLKTLREYFYPGIESINISPLDGTLLFYERVAALCPTSASILDYGAGSGDSISNMPISKQNLMLLKPNNIFRIGVDVDTNIKNNIYLNKSYVLSENDAFRIPLDDNSIDLVISDWVIEHLPNPQNAFKDIYRVLKPGGWFCARTANIYHYSYAIANIVKNSKLERRLLNVAQGERYTWPKAYLCNTTNKLSNELEQSGFTTPLIIPWEPEPAYLMNNVFFFICGLIWQKFASFGLLPKATLLIYAKKIQ